MKETDYLIIGSGAVGLAFADTLISEDPDCHITIVDKHPKPGGHWNDAYGFVALHQPSATYGVNSMAFPHEQIDTHGPNKGLYSLASGAEVLAYYERVMNMQLLPTGRVDYRRLSHFEGMDDEGTARVVSTFSGAETDIKVRRKVVDATFYKTSVPSTHKRNFAHGDDVSVEPPGALPGLWMRGDELPEHYVVLGAGKTAMDTVIWLIQAGTSPDDITWVRPRESWLWNREYIQPGEDFFEAVIEMQIAQLEATEKAETSADILPILSEGGYFLRIDESVEPEMFHYAVISQGEIDILRQVQRVIRQGRVQSIERGVMHFESTDVTVPDDTLFIDCTATAVPFSVQEDQGPLFRGKRIVLQPLQVPLLPFSAAIAAFIEVHFEDDETRNSLAMPGPLTDSPDTFAYAFMVNLFNRGAWSRHPNIMQFLSSSRLDLTSGTIAKLVADESPKLAMLQTFRKTIERCIPAVMKHGEEAKQLHESRI